MNKKQIYALRIAYCDLVGALQAYDKQDNLEHDWESHRESIPDLLDAFPELELDKRPAIDKFFAN